MFKLNFYGASKGNLGLADFEGICRDNGRRILFITLGSLGSDTNKSAELEGLIRGFEGLIRGSYLLAIIEGNSKILTQMENHLANRKDYAKVAMRWHLASRLDSLKTMLRVHPNVAFSHVR